MLSSKPELAEYRRICAARESAKGVNPERYRIYSRLAAHWWQLYGERLKGC